MIYEFKKWWGYHSIQFLILFIFLCPLVVSLIFINGAESYELERGEVETRTGIDALRNTNYREKSKEEYLSIEKIRKPLLYLKENWGDEDTYKTMEAKFPEYYHILYEAYESPINGKEHNIKNAKAENFYEEVNARRKERMGIEQSRELEIDDLSWLDKVEERIQDPFVIGETTSWVVLIKSLYLSLTCLIFLLLLIGNFIFALDREQNMEEILYVKGGKGQHVKRKKINTYLLISTLALIYDSLVCIFIIKIIGGKLPNVSIQVIPQFLISPYMMRSWTMLIYYLLMALMGVGSILIMNSIISNGLRNSVISALISISVLCICLYLKNKTYTGIGLQQLVLILPSSSIDILRILSIVSFVDLFGLKVSLFGLAIVINMGIAVVGYFSYFKVNCSNLYS
ncbi:MAG: hypothetical protein Q4E76_02880 [Tissierellia bacterium]|nr:hypothetical protein [Tissierellia bacterium]